MTKLIIITIISDIYPGSLSSTHVQVVFTNQTQATLVGGEATLVGGEFNDYFPIPAP